jgi:hypothetical protein
MAITGKPKKNSVNVEALIEKGGSVSNEDTATNTKRIFNLQLRIDEELLSRIDKVLEERKIKTPRHTWLLEAVHEKLEREQNKEV